MKKLLGIREASDLLGVSRHTIEKWKKKGKIPFYRLGRRCLFSEGALEEWLKEHEAVVKE